MAELRAELADVAASIAHTEEQVAATFDEIAHGRPAYDAEGLRATAEEARQYAVKERALAAKYRQPPDGGYPAAAARQIRA